MKKYTDTNVYFEKGFKIHKHSKIHNHCKLHKHSTDNVLGTVIISNVNV